MSAQHPLAGRRVLVTRPRERAAGLTDRLASLGAHPLVLPAIAFEPVPPAEVRARVADLPGPPEICIFNSPAAVEHGLALLPPLIPGRTAVAAIGPTTAERLGAHRVVVDIHPIGGMDSEALLAAPRLAADQVRDRRIWIVRGVGGRRLLAATLGERGARVEVIEVYRRLVPANSDSAVARECDIVTITSSETAHNLLAMLPESLRRHIRSRPVAVASDRIAAELRELGFTDNIAVAAGADAKSMAEAVVALATGESTDSE